MKNAGEGIDAYLEKLFSSAPEHLKGAWPMRPRPAGTPFRFPIHRDPLPADPRSSSSAQPAPAPTPVLPPASTESSSGVFVDYAVGGNAVTITAILSSGKKIAQLTYDIDELSDADILELTVRLQRRVRRRERRHLEPM